MESLKVEEGEFAYGQIMFRVSVTDGVNKLREIGMEFVWDGFGTTEKEAIDDFIRRNKSDILNVVFKV